MKKKPIYSKEGFEQRDKIRDKLFKQAELERQGKMNCENCAEEIRLKKYIEDELGSIFCSEDCLENSLDYRGLKAMPKFEEKKA